MDVGNPKYWLRRAIEHIMEADNVVEGSVAYHNLIKESVTLLLLTRASANEKNQSKSKARKRPARSDSTDAKAE